MSECGVERAGALATIRLASSVLTARVAGALSDACALVETEDEIRVLLLTSDAAGWPETCQLAGEAEHALAAAAVDALSTLRKPTLAAIAGPARGPGLEIALACDLRLAGAAAMFALPQLTEGTMPFLGGTQRLPRVIGRARSLDLLLTGRTIDAALALAWGLVTAVVAEQRLEEEARTLAGALVSAAPLAAGLAKEAVHAAFDLPLAQGLRLEEDLYVLLQTSGDRAEGVRAFLERRSPRFRGV